MPAELPMRPGPEAVVAGPGADERHIVRGTVLQQVASFFGLAVMLVVITAIGRTLSLEEFGVYGLSISVAASVLVAQAAVSGATVRALAAAPDAASRDRTLSTATAIYAGIGLLAGSLVAAGGGALAGVLGIPDELTGQARTGFAALGALIALGWPSKACQDALRGTQRFGAAALGELGAYAVLGVGMGALLALDAPLWTLIALGGSISVLIGVMSAAPLVLAGVGPRMRLRAVDRDEARGLLGISGGLLAGGAAELLIYSMDRVILAAFRSAATVGLYEGAARAHNLLRVMQGTLVLTVTPVASGYLARGDELRVRELLLRGTRYVMAVVTPVTVVLIVLAEPILEVWLGPEFGEAGLAMAILCSYWLVGGATGVAGSMLVAAGRVRILAQYAWTVAITNFALSIALTPWLGLEGIVLGTSIPYFMLLPWFVRAVLGAFPAVRLRELMRDAVLPAYTGAVLLAAALGTARVAFELDTAPEVALVGVCGLAAYWLGYYLLWLAPNERMLLWSFVRRRP